MWASGPMRKRGRGLGAVIALTMTAAARSRAIPRFAASADGSDHHDAGLLPASRAARRHRGRWLAMRLETPRRIDWAMVWAGAAQMSAC